MSYCRFGWDGSDVYVILTEDGYTCYCKPITVTETPEGMIAHLASHRRDGKFVPPSAVAELWEEIDGPGEPVRPEPPEIARTHELLRKAIAETVPD